MIRPLYEIDRDLLDCFDPETGEILDEDQFEALQIERDAKIEGVALAIKNLKVEFEAYAAEEKNFKAKKEAAAKKIEGMSEFLRAATREQNFHSIKVDVKFRKNPVSVQIDDDAEIPNEFYLPVRVPDPKLDKIAIKEALANGAEIKGCRLVQNISMSVK